MDELAAMVGGSIDSDSSENDFPITTPMHKPKAKATPHPPPHDVDLSPAPTLPAPPEVDSDPLEDLMEQFPAGGEFQDESETPI